MHHLRPAPGAKKAKTRVGRGEGSKGKTAGRGTKGTKARYQVPSASRVGRCRCTCGCRSCAASRTRSASSTRSSTWTSSSGSTPRVATSPSSDLVAKGAVRKNEKVKVLGTGDIAVKLNVAVDKVSGSAEEKIVAAGGSVNVALTSEPHRDSAPGAGTPGPGVLSSPGLIVASTRSLSRPPGGPRVHRLRAGLPHAGPAQEDRVHARRSSRSSGSGRSCPTPGVGYSDRAGVPSPRPASRPGLLLGLVNLFSGGALLQLSIFALGIMPYITATIIVQLLRWSSRTSRPSTRRARPARPS